MGQFGISQPVPRRGDDKLLRGAGRFIDDLAPDGLVHGHGIRHIDMPATPERVWPAIQGAALAKPDGGS